MTTKPPKELLEVFNLKERLLGVEERDAFYAKSRLEYEETGKITRQVRTIRLLLMNSQGRVYVQRRSATKSDNAGLYDKTIGGHVPAGFTFDLVVTKECAEELGFPAAVVGGEDFEKAKAAVPLGVIGIFHRIDYQPGFMSARILKSGERFVQPLMNAFYVGYYDGAIRFADGESSGIEVFSPAELKADIAAKPDKYTEDLKYMIKKYGKYLKPIRKR